MTDENLPERIEALLAAASPGPWWASNILQQPSTQVVRYNRDDEQRPNIIGSFDLAADAELAALARAALQSVAKLIRALVGLIRACPCLCHGEERPCFCACYGAEKALAAIEERFREVRG